MKIIKLLFLVGIALAAGFFAPDLIQKLQDSSNEVDLSAYCMLSTTPCLQNGTTMTLEHDVTRPLVPTALNIKWPDSNAELLQIKLQGLEMDMGIARYNAKKQQNGTYEATLLLPVCTAEKMTWVGTITDGKQTVLSAIKMER